MNKLLGAQHFVVYNYSVSSNVDLILRQYQKDGLMTVLPWSIPTLDSWYYAQMTALNDCFFRNRNSSRFVVVIDTDELIIPRNHSTWIELMDNVARQEMKAHSPSATNGRALIGSYMIRSSLFNTSSSDNWDSLPSGISFTKEEKTSVARYKMHWFLDYWRSRVIFPARIRSKYIARPELVDISGIHYVHKFIGGARYVNVSVDLALVHHYRKKALLSELNRVVKKGNTSVDQGNGFLQDIVLFKFKHKIYPRLIERYKQFDYMFS